MSASELRERLGRLFEQGKYREALPLGKELVKREDTPDSRRFLVQAYQGRIRALSGKGMMQEASALLDTMVARCGEVEGVDRLRLVLAVRSGSWTRAMQVYMACFHDLEEKDRQKIEALFGAALLLESGAPGALLPEDSLVPAHLPQAEKALQAFNDGDVEGVRTALQSLPFRSPYRDFRFLLGGCLLLDEDPAGAERFFGKIPPDSPYAPVAGLCRIRSFGGREILDAWQHGSPEEQEAIGRVLGLQARETRLLSSLANVGRDGYRFYRAISKEGGCLPADTRRRLLKRLLPHCGERIIDILMRKPSGSLDEDARQVALAAELDRELEVAIASWEDYLEILDPDDPRSALKSALVLRRMAELIREIGNPYGTKIRQEFLYRSLRYDPGHVESWLQVIELAKRFDGLKRSYQLVNEALDKLPDEPVILLTAMEAAAQRRAFKKAATLARRVLAIDPINTRARKFLLASHLGHGRKLVLQGKFELARREFEAADMDVRSLRYRGRGLICLGMLAFVEGDPEEGLTWIARGREMNGSALFSRLLTLFEACLFELPPAQIKEFTGELRAVAGEPPVREEVLQLAEMLNSLGGQKWVMFKDIIRPLKGYFSRAASLEWGREDGKLLCRALEKGGFLVALAKAAGPLHKAWPDDPEIEAYELLGRARNNCKLLHSHDLSRMAALGNEFERAGNHYLANSLREAVRRARLENPKLRQHEAARIPRRLFRQLIEDFFDDDDEDDDPFFPEPPDFF